MATIEKFAKYYLPDRIDFIDGLVSKINNPHFKAYVANTVSNLFLDETNRMQILQLFESFETNKGGFKIRLINLCNAYCIVIRYIKEYYSIVEQEFHSSLEDFEKQVADGTETEQEYIEFCDDMKDLKSFVDLTFKFYKDSSNIYFIAVPDDDEAIIISVNGLPDGDNLVKYMFNYDMERDRCIALKVKQMEAERKAKQAKDDAELIQAFEEQKAKSKKQSVQDLTKQANKKKAKEQRLRKEFEKSAAEKELEKLKEKKKKQQKKSSSA